MSDDEMEPMVKWLSTLRGERTRIIGLHEFLSVVKVLQMLGQQPTICVTRPKHLLANGPKCRYPTNRQRALPSNPWRSRHRLQNAMPLAPTSTPVVDSHWRDRRPIRSTVSLESTDGKPHPDPALQHPRYLSRAESRQRSRSGRRRRRGGLPAR